LKPAFDFQTALISQVYMRNPALRDFLCLAPLALGRRLAVAFARQLDVAGQNQNAARAVPNLNRLNAGISC
jgi:hypothetical protein